MKSLFLGMLVCLGAACAERPSMNAGWQPAESEDPAYEVPPNIEVEVTCENAGDTIVIDNTNNNKPKIKKRRRHHGR